MIDSQHYQNYKGPNLILAEIWKKEDNKENITEYIQNFYTENNNWNGKLYTYNDIFPGKDYTYKFKVVFLDDNKRKHWFHGMVGNPEQYFNPPLATPMNQNII
tara:strand:+ start:63 stop:371 length:309 start_codon:yes stop_codon:yes gene_type:complete